MSPIQLRDGDLVMIKGKTYRIQDHFLHLHTKDEYDEDTTLKDIYHDIGSVLDGDLPMNVALLRKWRGVISNNVPDWNKPTDKEHLDRLVNNAIERMGEAIKEAERQGFDILWGVAGDGKWKVVVLPKKKKK